MRAGEKGRTYQATVTLQIRVGPNEGKAQIENFNHYLVEQGKKGRGRGEILKVFFYRV